MDFMLYNGEFIFKKERFSYIKSLFLCGKAYHYSAIIYPKTTHFLRC